MVNFNTTNVVIAYYPRQSGGKFLLNCLGLSNQMVLQDHTIAQKQLDNKLTQQDIFDLLIGRTRNSKNVDKFWGDLDLGCGKLFGTDSLDYNSFHPIIDQLSKSNFLFPVIIHNFNLLTELCKIWPNAKILHLINEGNFIQKYRPNWQSVCTHDQTKIDITWNAIRGESWPECSPKSVEEYNKLPEFIKKEDQQLHSHAILNLTTDYSRTIDKLLNNDTVRWDCDWFLDLNTFQQEIKNLYAQFRVTNFSKDMISQFYIEWLDCLESLRCVNPV